LPAKVEKTNAMRVLEARGVAYEAHYYPAERHSAEEVAVLIGRPPEQVFKTLVVMPLEAKARPLLAVVPGNRELDLKLLAKAAGQKKLRMATQREAESLTGLLVGGISALALLNKGFKVYLMPRRRGSSGSSSVAATGGQSRAAHGRPGGRHPRPGLCPGGGMSVQPGRFTATSSAGG
jgi:Cys-tRNA(Pro)/Cys-tRNA(Cys) deacylase